MQELDILRLKANVSGAQAAEAPAQILWGQGQCKGEDPSPCPLLSHLTPPWVTVSDDMEDG